MATSGDQLVLVSVVIPTRNRSTLLQRAVLSCQRQSTPVHEIIVVDDASNDATQALVSSLAERDSRICYIRLPCNRGAQAARLEGIKVSSGDWVVFLDSDDELLPQSIEARLAAAGKHRNGAGLVYGDVYTGAVEDERLVRFKHLEGYAFPWLCKELCLCPYSAMMVRRACFPVAGYPDLDFPSWQDDDMALTIGRFFPVLHCGLPVAVMYPGTERITSNWERLAKGCKLMVRKYRKDIVRYHGYSRLVLWWLRILRACLLSYQEGCKETNLYSRNGIRKYTPFHLGSVGRHHVLSLAVMILDWALRDKFEYIFA